MGGGDGAAFVGGGGGFVAWIAAPGGDGAWAFAVVAAADGVVDDAEVGVRAGGAAAAGADLVGGCTRGHGLPGGAVVDQLALENLEAVAAALAQHAEGRAGR